MKFKMGFVSFFLIVLAAQAVPAADTPSDKTTGKEVIVTYFHGKVRCQSCQLIERYTEEAVKERFSDHLKNGVLVYRAVDVDIPENRHFIQDYLLYSRAVVVAENEGGKQTRWKNLDRIWALARNQQAFQNYIHDEVAAYLETGP